MRYLIHDALVTALALDPVAGRVYPSGALGVGTVPAAPELPYVQYNFGQSTAYGVSDVNDPHGIPLNVLVYDELGSFLRIDDIVRTVRDTVIGLVGRVSTSGRQCTDVGHPTIGRDQTDIVSGNASKVITFRITSQI